MATTEERPPFGERSFALITTLAILSILTIMLLAFMSIVSTDRQSTQSYSQGIQADELAQGGLARIVSQMRAEAAQSSDPTLSTNLSNPAVPVSTNYPISRPLKAAAAVPQRMAIPALADPALANILKVSVPSSSGIAFYTNTDGTPGQGGTNFASAALSTARSLNGRSVSLARWNKPLLTTSAAGFPAPAWVMAGRSGPIVAPAAGSSSLSTADAVLGRYAYVVYDVSGLIDVTVAGHPSGVSVGNKGLLPWADLTQLGLSGSDVDALVAWRNQANAGNYASYVTNWSANGFMRVAPGDTTFLTRQELIKYAQTQNSGLVAALPYLTTFSRELNGPVCGPGADAPFGAPYDYLTHQYGATTTTRAVSSGYGAIAANATVYGNNVFILNPRVQNAYTNGFGIVRKAGEPLVKYRFPLDKLALLEAVTNSATWAQHQDEIQRCFGLDYVLTAGNDPQGNPLASGGLYRHWSYPTTNPSYSHPAASNGRVLTLDEVAALKRDPDFFELLQAGILSGSLGKAGRGDWAGVPSAVPDFDGNIGYQIVRIGAAAIDQWDSDSCPTTITFNGWNFYGVEDLPYINELFIKAYSTVPQTAASGTVTPFVYCELWNPHQNTSPASVHPTNFRLVPTANDTIAVSAAAGPFPGGNAHWLMWPPSGSMRFSALAGGGVMSFSATPAEYREPSLIYAGSPKIAAANVLNTNPQTAGQLDRGVPIVGLTLPTASLPALGASGGPVTWPPPLPAATWQIQMSGQFGYTLQYQDPSNPAVWHAYGTFAGMEPTTANPGVNWALALNQWEDVAVEGTPTAATANSGSYVKSDPRTARWAAAFTLWVGRNDTPQNAGNSLSPIAGTSANYDLVWAETPFGIGNVNNVQANPFRFDLWSTNTNNVSGAPSLTAYPVAYYTDQDQVRRYGDAVYPAGAHSPFYPADPTRPVILNRPFTSVGDLGNVYRDIPWRSLDFFSPNSADTALLDLFTLSDGPVVAGHVNPNSASLPVLQALLSGANLSSDSGPTLPNATAVAAAFRGAATNAPFVSRSDVVARFMTNAAIAGVSPNSVKGEREAVIRAVVESANTRTWNFLIDIVAQSGRYPPGTASLDNFTVEGERRYWMHVAIDRFTGEIVDQQLEVVNQ